MYKAKSRNLQSNKNNDSDDINDIDLSQIDSLINIININTIKGGFPRIKICDTEISHNKIMSIKDMLKLKKKIEPSSNLLNRINGIINEEMNIIEDNNVNINGVAINLITGKNTKLKISKSKVKII